MLYYPENAPPRGSPETVEGRGTTWGVTEDVGRGLDNATREEVYSHVPQ